MESAAACILHLGQDGVEVEDRRELLLFNWLGFFVASRFSRVLHEPRLEGGLVNESAASTFWERLAARSQASGALASIEDPITVARIVTVAFWSAAAIASSAALALF